MSVAVTGASGFVGGHLCRTLRQASVEVIVLGRNPPPSGSELSVCEYMPYSLEEGLSGRLPLECEAVIHCAYAMGVNGAIDPQMNLHAVEMLRAATRLDKTRRFIFVSSMSAHPTAESWYGKSKWQIERKCNLAHDLIIKPGLVVGQGGLFQRMRQSISRLPIIPLFDGGSQPVQTIAASDLSRAVEISLRHRMTGTLLIASPVPVTMRELYLRIMEVDGLKKPFISLPSSVCLAFLSWVEKLHIHLPVTSENLRGLRALKTFDTRESIARLGIELESLDDTLRAS